MSALPPTGRADLRRRGLRLIWGGLALEAVGILITALTISLADPGDTYRVAVGPMIIGVVLVIMGIVQITRSRGAGVAGWQPDPTGQHDRRWWDGAQWTSRVMDGGTEATDPIGGPEAGPSGPSGGFANP